jgi:hypothetical protein
LGFGLQGNEYTCTLSLMVANQVCVLCSVVFVPHPLHDLFARMQVKCLPPQFNVQGGLAGRGFRFSLQYSKVLSDNQTHTFVTTGACTVSAVSVRSLRLSLPILQALIRCRTPDRP